MLALAARPGTDQPSLMDVSDPPPPGAGEVRCRTLELGVCGTDREILLSKKPALPAGCDRLVLGHECLGVVEEIGPDVTELRRGDLVVPVVRRALPQFEHTFRVDMLAFGQFVERGIFHADGFSAESWLDRPEYLLAVSSELRPWAVLAEPLAVSEKAVNEALVIQRARLGARHWTDDPPRVLVTGQGPIGFTAVLACIARGWPVTMLGRDSADSFRSTLVRRFGAGYQPLEATDFSPRDVEQDGYDLVLECTGSDQVMLDATALLAARGVMVWLGSTRMPEPRVRNVEKLMRDGILRNHVHIATVNSAPRDFADALRHLDVLRQKHAAELSDLITARVTPADALWHLTHRQPQGIKTVVNYG